MSTPPLPIFDSLEFINDNNDFSYLGNQYNFSDIKIAIAFLKAYKERISLIFLCVFWELSTITIKSKYFCSN